MTQSPHLLVVDDDQAIRSLLRDFLCKYGFQVSTAQDGVEMFNILKQDAVTLIILDIMLPGDDGFLLCRKVRAQSQIPILMLTAVGEETDRIVGLELGADDYLSKPFNPRELLARIKAILRRTNDSASSASTCYQFDGWTLDTSKRRLLSPEALEISLSASEYDLLLTFAENEQRVLSRDQLLESTKNRSATPFDRSIDIQISRLRQKIEPNPKNPTLIKTIRGGGYLFTPQVETQ